MKLLDRSADAFTFLIGKRERDLFITLLRRYPVINTAHFHARAAADLEARKNHELLEEALAEQQRENRRNLEEMLSQPSRFTESELGFIFTLSAGEIEWVLQILNDIRVGSWVRLGQPTASLRQLPDLSEENMQLAWSMEMAGLFEHSLLEAARS